jgi:hypothetical protein
LRGFLRDLEEALEARANSDARGRMLGRVAAAG